MTFLIKYAVAAGLALSASTAHAVVFDLSYTLESGQVLTADIEGILQGDMNTVIVSGVTNAALDGVLGAEIVVVNSFSDVFIGSTAPPVLTLDGTALDFVAFDAAEFDGFSFDTVALQFGSPLFTSGSSYGATRDLYNPANYSLTAASATIPIPATAWLMIAALGALGAARRAAR
ncbi:MAG: VPLPA-CTERM sorting domain-containing protein [Pseudomonadota bacterium]